MYTTYLSKLEFDQTSNLRYAESIGESITQMNQLYDQLSKLQGEAYTSKEGNQESCPEVLIGNWFTITTYNSSPRFTDKTTEIINKMKEVTKADIALNNLVVRAKWFWPAFDSYALVCPIQVEIYKY